VRFHLWQVKVGTRAALDELGGVVVKVEAKVEEGGRDGLAVDDDMFFEEMPASRTGDEGG
jgi:hypothetical protein